MLLSKGFASPQVTDLIAKFAPQIESVSSYIEKNIEKTAALQKCGEISALGVEKEAAKTIAVTLEAMSCFSLVLQNNETNLNEYLHIYYTIKQGIALHTINGWVNNLPIENQWKKLAVRELEEKLRVKYCKLVAHVASLNKDCDLAISHWKSAKAAQILAFEKFVEEISKIPNQDFAIISMLVDKLDTIQ